MEGGELDPKTLKELLEKQDEVILRTGVEKLLVG